MDAVEDLAWFDDAPGGSRGQLCQLVAAGTVNTGKPENMHRDAAAGTERKPCPLDIGARLRTRLARRRRRRFVDPAAGMVAIEADGREITDPAQIGCRSYRIGERRE